MAQVRIPLGAATLGSNRVEFGTTDASSPGLGSLRALSSDRAAFLGWLRLIALATPRINMNVGGTSGRAGTAGPDLSDAWEGNAAAITIEAPTLRALVVPGPTNAAATSQDTSEPYGWNAPVSYSGGLTQWLTDFRALSSSQKGQAVAVFDDGVATEKTGSGTALKARGSLRDATGRATASVRETALHTYTVTSGVSGTITGYWDGNAGSIADANYNTPNGSSARIRQTMVSDAAIGVNELRFLLNQTGLGTGDVDQFPRRIVTTRGSLSATWLPSDPEQIAAFGQGIGRDYTMVSGGDSGVFANGQETQVTLYYEAILALSDFAQPAQTTLVCAALIAAGANAQSGGIALYNAPAHQAADSGSLLDGDLIYAPDE